MLTFGLLGLAVGALYALMALGIVVIYRGSATINIAQGATGTLAAYTFYGLRDDLHLDTLAALGIALGVVALVGATTYLLIMRPLANASAQARFVATIGLLGAMQAILTLAFGTDTRQVSSPLPSGIVNFAGGTVIPVDRIGIVAIVVVLAAACWAAFRYTRFGLAVTAVSENPVAFASLGRSPHVIATINWMLGGVLGGVAGILLAPIAGLNPIQISVYMLVPALVAALFGNFVSFPLTVVGALVLGVLQSEVSQYVPVDGAGAAVPFIVLMMVLGFRGSRLPSRAHIALRPPAVGSGRVRPALVVATVVIALVLVLWGLSPSWVDAVIVTLIVGLLCLSLVVVTGYAGQVSLAQYVIAGIGAWAAGRLIATHVVGFELGIVLGIGAAVLVGLVVGLPSVRARGASLAIATLGMAFAIESLVTNSTSMTGGMQGTNIGAMTLFGLDVDALLYPRRFAVVCIAAFLLVALGVAWLRRSRFGRRMLAIRTNERAAAALGVDVARAKLLSFCIGAGIAGLAGVLSSYRTPHVIFDSFTSLNSLTLLSFAFVGGIAYIPGALLGALMAPGSLGARVIQLVLPGGSEQAALILQLVGAALLVLTVLWNPDGIAPLMIERIKRLLRRWKLRFDDPVAAEWLEQPRAHRARPLALDVSDITVTYGGTRAVDHVSLHVEPGEIVGVIGPNGAGKTSLIDALTGYAVAEGAVLLGSTDASSASPEKRAHLGLGRSFQSLELFEDLTVEENLRTAAEGIRAARADVGKGRISRGGVAAAHAFGLTDSLQRRPNELSYGQRRLVGIARALAAEPSVLLLDEPAAGLDSTETQGLGELLKQMALDWGLAILIVEHDVSLMMEICDKILVIESGRMVAQGSPEEIAGNSDVKRAYLGETSPGSAGK